MIKVIFLIFGLLLIYPAFAQKITALDTTIYSDVDEYASFSGSKAKMMKYLSTNLVYPESHLDDFSGKMWFRFVVEIDGKTSNVQLFRPADQDETWVKQMIVLIESMPNLIPGKINGVAVRSFFDLPINICF